MNTSPSIANIAPALIKAQANIGAASKDAKNPFYSSTYADLGSVMAVCKEPLLAQGISVIQPITTRENGDIVLETILLHESGEFIASSMKITPPRRMVVPKSDKERFEPYLAPDPQAEGSAITYARRYALQAMVFIPSVDDDAEWAERALARRPLTPETAEKLGTAVDQTLAAADAATDEGERQRLHKEAMKLEKGIQNRTPAAIAIAKYEDENPEHRNKVACATQDDKGNWIFTLIGGEEKPAKATRKQRSAAATVANTSVADDIDQTPTQGMDTPWIDFVCLRGQTPGPFNGKTLGHIFTEGSFAPKSPAMLEKLVAAFVKQAIPTSSDPHDKILWAKVQEADAELRAGFAPEATTAPAGTQTTPEPQKGQAASPTRWQDFVIPGRHPDFAGKTLGSLGADGVKRLQDEYLVQIEWSKATLPQKSLKAQVALAAAELFPKDIPPAESEQSFDHTKMLRDLIAGNQWSEAFFITVCKLNTWIPESVRKIEDISAESFEGLESGWSTVEEEMAKARQPAQQP